MCRFIAICRPSLPLFHSTLSEPPRARLGTWYLLPQLLRANDPLCDVVAGVLKACLISGLLMASFSSLLRQPFLRYTASFLFFLLSFPFLVHSPLVDIPSVTFISSSGLQKISYYFLDSLIRNPIVDFLLASQSFSFRPILHHLNLRAIIFKTGPSRPRPVDPGLTLSLTLNP